MPDKQAVHEPTGCATCGRDDICAACLWLTDPDAVPGLPCTPEMEAARATYFSTESPQKEEAALARMRELGLPMWGQEAA